MKKKIIITLYLIVALFLICYLFNNFLLRHSIPGTYVNTNYKYRPFLAEIPYIPDTLIIRDDNTFSSPYFGKGSYKLSYSIHGTMIELKYNDSEFETYIRRSFFNRLQIVLFKDQNHYYQKIK